MDKAGEKYWSNIWENNPLPNSLTFKKHSINSYLNIRFDECFEEIFSTIETKNAKLLEIGCGNSVWLPYFNQRFGFEVNGLDYSPQGCDSSKKILEREGIVGGIYCEDFFNPSKELLGKYDVVVSLGVAEHFTDTTEAIKAFSKFLKPGGILVTEIPNLSSSLGFLQKTFNKEVYDIHVPLDKEELKKAHENAGLSVFLSRYVVGISLQVNLDEKNKPIKYKKLKRLIVYSLSLIVKIIWIIEYTIGWLPGNKCFSPIIFVAAKNGKSE